MADRGQHYLATLGRAFGAEKEHDGTVIASVGRGAAQQGRHHLLMTNLSSDGEGDTPARVAFLGLQRHDYSLVLPQGIGG
jgi:hypothetical protein